MSTRHLGIWMDYSTANLIELEAGTGVTQTIVSDFTHQLKETSLSKIENTMHTKERQANADYYRKLGEVIKNFDDVLLFGPTEAKVELFNVLIADHHFSKVRIKVKQADKMTDNQQHTFVRAYFTMLPSS